MKLFVWINRHVSVDIYCGIVMVMKFQNYFEEELCGLVNGLFQSALMINPIRWCCRWVTVTPLEMPWNVRLLQN